MSALLHSASNVKPQPRVNLIAHDRWPSSTLSNVQRTVTHYSCLWHSCNIRCRRCFEPYISHLVCSGAAGLDLARESDRDGGEHQDHADHRKGVAESQHQRLSLDGIAQRDDGLLMCRGGIGHAVIDEEVGQL